MTREPQPFADSSQTPANLRDMITDARADQPSEQELASLMTRLDAIDAGAVGAAGFGLAKILPFALVFVCVGVGGLWYLGQGSESEARLEKRSELSKPTPTPESSVSSAPPERAPAPPLPAPPERAPAPAPPSAAKAVTALPSESDAGRAVPAKAATGGAGDLASPAAEVALIERARSALHASRWNQALAALALHKRHHPRGILSEEREAIAIEALAASGSTAFARVRLQAFTRSHPKSSYRARLLQLVGDTPE